MDERNDKVLKELADVVKENSAIVETFKDAFVDTQKSHMESQKRYETLARETRKSFEDLAEENRADRKVEASRQRRDTYVITAVSVLSICVTSILGFYLTQQIQKMKSRDSKLAALYREKSEIKEEINARFSERNALMKAMVDLRGVRDQGQRECKNGAYAGRDSVSYTQRLFQADYNLVGVALETTGIFEQSKIMQFLTISSVDKTSICNKNAPTDQQLRTLQTQINLDILKDINQLRTRKADIAKGITSIEYGIDKN